MYMHEQLKRMSGVYLVFKFMERAAFFSSWNCSFVIMKLNCSTSTLILTVNFL